MNAYVSRLIARAHGRLAVAQPRLPGRFEPARISSTPMSLETAPLVTETTPGPVAPRDLSWPEPASTVFARSSASPRSPSAETPAVPTSRGKAADEPPERRLPFPAPPEATSEFASRAAPITPAPLEPARDAPLPRPAVDASRDATAMSRAAARIVAETSVRAPAPRGGEDAPASAEPVIHVTIGRVDVRAATPQAIIRPTPNAAKRGESLDEFLARVRRK